MERDFQSIFETMISGQMSDKNIAAALISLEERGITADDLRVGAQVLRARMNGISAPENTMDIVGTGGDGLSTYNISTACCFVVAGAGVPVAKHGNRAVSSKSGASDVLRELGIRLDIDKKQTELCIRESGVCFLFAPNHHTAMKHVAGARALIKTRTIFNCLGPLVNPASVNYILTGVYSNSLRKIYVEALKELGTKRALVVHGDDGMDEITTTTTTHISELRNGNITEYTLDPTQFSLAKVSPQNLVGGNPLNNAKALLAVLDGQPGAYRDIVVLNSGAALYVSGHSGTISDGIHAARKSIDSGQASKALRRLIRVSND